MTNCRADFINSILGKPWEANAKGPYSFDCWHLCVYIHSHLFDRTLPNVDVPPKPSWQWLIRTISSHSERKHWCEVPNDRMGLVLVGDGALVLMARSDRPAHVGVWLKAERLIVHADPTFGVVNDRLTDLRAKGWVKLRFFEPC